MSKRMTWITGVLALVVLLTGAGLPSRAEALTGWQSRFGPEGKGAGELENAAGIALDAAGDLWVTDKEGDRVEKFSQSGEYLTEFGSHGSGPGQFSRPTGIDIDSEGNLWIADWENSRVEEFTSEGEFLRSIGSWGYGNGHFRGPDGVAVDGEGNIWVADTANDRIQKFDSEGNFIEVVSPAGLGTIEPVAITVGTDGVVWVADSMNDRLVAFDEAGALLKQFGFEGSGPGELDYPSALAVGPEGNVWVSEAGNQRVQEFSAEGESLDTFGSEGSALGHFQIGAPGGIAVASEGRFWATSGFAYQVQAWGPETQPTCSPAGAEVDTLGSLQQFETMHCEGGGPVHYELASLPSHGEITEWESETRYFMYKPEPGFVGHDSFTFTATNGIGTAVPATFEIFVGGYPECENTEVVIPAGQAFTFPGQFPCEGEGPFEYQVNVAEIKEELQGGKISQFDPKTGSFVYTPKAGFAGSDYFTYLAKNRFGASPLRFFSITVRNAPTCRDGSAETAPGEYYSLLGGQLECEGEGTNRWQIVSGPGHGEISEFDESTGALTYTPEPEYEGNDFFTFKMIGEAGDSEVKTFRFTIAPPISYEPPE